MVRCKREEVRKKERKVKEKSAGEVHGECSHGRIGSELASPRVGCMKREKKPQGRAESARVLERAWRTTNADAESIDKSAEFTMRCDGMDVEERLSQ
jgi:hypothetical protein